VRIVDAQCHVSTRWYEPVETLLAQMDRNGVAQAVLIQMLGEFDNGYQQACALNHPDRFVSVVAVDPTTADACDRLAALAAEGAVGVRLKPDARSPVGDPLALWRVASDLQLAVSCVGTAETFGAPEFFELIASLPALPIVLEHLGGTSQAGATDLPARRRVFEIAEFPNVYLKVPGLGELLPRSRMMPNEAPLLESAAGAAPTQGALREPRSVAPSAKSPLFESPLAELELALERFGPERLMWGSDFPVVGGREGYANALAGTQAAMAAPGPDALASVFGGTAGRVFKLN
jgi:L-fuconolactonase